MRTFKSQEQFSTFIFVMSLIIYDNTYLIRGRNKVKNYSFVYVQVQFVFLGYSIYFSIAVMSCNYHPQHWPTAILLVIRGMWYEYE